MLTPGDDIDAFLCLFFPVSPAPSSYHSMTSVHPAPQKPPVSPVKVSDLNQQDLEAGLKTLEKSPDVPRQADPVLASFRLAAFTSSRRGGARSPRNDLATYPFDPTDAEKSSQSPAVRSLQLRALRAAKMTADERRAIVMEAKLERLQEQWQRVNTLVPTSAALSELIDDVSSVADPFHPDYTPDPAQGLAPNPFHDTPPSRFIWSCSLM